MEPDRPTAASSNLSLLFRPAARSLASLSGEAVARTCYVGSEILEALKNLEEYEQVSYRVIPHLDDDCLLHFLGDGKDALEVFAGSAPSDFLSGLLIATVQRRSLCSPSLFARDRFAAHAANFFRSSFRHAILVRDVRSQRRFLEKLGVFRILGGGVERVVQGGEFDLCLSAVNIPSREKFLADVRGAEMYYVHLKMDVFRAELDYIGACPAVTDLLISCHPWHLVPAADDKEAEHHLRDWMINRDASGKALGKYCRPAFLFSLFFALANFRRDRHSSALGYICQCLLVLAESKEGDWKMSSGDSAICRYLFDVLLLAAETLSHLHTGYLSLVKRILSTAFGMLSLSSGGSAVEDAGEVQLLLSLQRIASCYGVFGLEERLHLRLCDAKILCYGGHYHLQSLQAHADALFECIENAFVCIVAAGHRHRNCTGVCPVFNSETDRPLHRLTVECAELSSCVESLWAVARTLSERGQLDETATETFECYRHKKNLYLMLKICSRTPNHTFGDEWFQLFGEKYIGQSSYLINLMLLIRCKDFANFRSLELAVDTELLKMELNPSADAISKLNRLFSVCSCLLVATKFAGFGSIRFARLHNEMLDLIRKGAQQHYRAAFVVYLGLVTREENSCRLLGEVIPHPLLGGELPVPNEVQQRRGVALERIERSIRENNSRSKTYYQVILRDLAGTASGYLNGLLDETDAASPQCFDARDLLCRLASSDVGKKHAELLKRARLAKAATTSHHN